jgi:predicted O-methyltransferase YrrM
VKGESADIAPPQTLRSIIAQYGHTDKDTWHSYVNSYEKLLEPFQNKACNVLEIGVFEGGSAILWHEYLPKSQLVLVDIQNQIAPKIQVAMDPKRWNLHVRDAYREDTVMELQKKCPGGFDIIIDDGPHSLDSQVFVIESYLKLLKKGGILIIEDIEQIDHIPVLSAKVPSEQRLQVEVIDLRRLKGRFDDILFIIRNCDS